MNGWSSVVATERSLSWVSKVGSVDTVVSVDSGDVVGMAEWVVEEHWVELVEKVVMMPNCSVGQVVSTYVPSCKFPTEWLATMAESEVWACCVGAGQLHSWVRTIEGRMVVIEVVHVDRVDFAQAQVSPNDRSQPWLQTRSVG